MGFRECCQVIWLYAGVEAFREWNDQRNEQGLCRVSWVQHVSRHQGNQSTVCSIHGLQTACRRLALCRRAALAAAYVG